MTMAKYIDYDLFKKDLEKRWDVNDDSDFANKEVWHALEEAPAADVVERNNGKWIWDDEGYHCSECFYHADGNTAEIYSGQYNYCPNCGARMEET